MGDEGLVRIPSFISEIIKAHLRPEICVWEEPPSVTLAVSFQNYPAWYRKSGVLLV